MSDTSNCFLRLPISVDLCGIEERLDRIESRIDGLRQSLFSKIDRETNELAADLAAISAQLASAEPAKLQALADRMNTLVPRLSAMGRDLDGKPST